MAELLPVLFFCGLLALSQAYSGPDLPPGPYCGQQDQCCRNRVDDCSHPILDTLCYCDEFCNNRTLGHDDCCPDYPEVCLGISPPPNLKKPCRHGSKLYVPGDTREDGCNTCECIEVDGQTSWRCDRDPCIIDDDIIRRVNGDHRIGWRAYNYTQFYGKKLKDGLVYKLGTFPLSPETRRLGPINLDKERDYPPEFDARKEWPKYISPVMDQGWCGSDWAISLATIASDRFAIQSNGAEKVILSPQTLLSCNVRGQRGCDGGHIDIAWRFASIHGLVDEDCFPYQAKMSRCPYKRFDDLIGDGCRPVVPQRTSRYRVGPPGRLMKEQDIMYDIMQSGPIQAVMTVYQDFFHYRDGIYRHSRYGDNELKGYHSVRMIGWGERNGDRYWIMANSWGPEWGENGYFRIARGEDESGIESFIVTVLSDVTEAYLRK